MLINRIIGKQHAPTKIHPLAVEPMPCMNKVFVLNVAVQQLIKS